MITRYQAIYRGAAIVLWQQWQRDARGAVLSAWKWTGGGQPQQMVCAYPPGAREPTELMVQERRLLAELGVQLTDLELARGELVEDPPVTNLLEPGTPGMVDSQGHSR